MTMPGHCRCCTMNGRHTVLDVRTVTFPGGQRVDVAHCGLCDRRRCGKCQRPIANAAAVKCHNCEHVLS